MPIFVDARIAVVFAPPVIAGPDDAVLAEAGAPLPAVGPGAGPPVTWFDTAAAADHAAGCTCCAPRTPVAEALQRLFLARVRSGATPFRRVVVHAGPHGQACVRDAVLRDPFASCRYRLGGAGEGR